MKSYIVKSPLDHDHKRHDIGATVELSDEQAAPLLSTKPPVIEEVADFISASPTDTAARCAAILSAINQLDQEDAALWLKDGRPNTAALEKVLGWKVTATERDTAYADWKTAQAAQG